MGCEITFLHFSAPSPVKTTRPESSSLRKLSSVTVTALSAPVLCTVIPVPLPVAEKGAVYTSILRASIMGKIRYRSRNGARSTYSCAISSRELTCIRGMEAPKQRPLAVETPTRSPVYDPGPPLTATAAQSLICRPHSRRISSIKTASMEACTLGSADWRRAMIPVSSESETEQTAVLVSINRNRCTYFGVFACFIFHFFGFRFHFGPVCQCA